MDYNNTSDIINSMRAAETLFKTELIIGRDKIFTISIKHTAFKQFRNHRAYDNATKVINRHRFMNSAVFDSGTVKLRAKTAGTNAYLINKLNILLSNKYIAG